MFFSGAIDQTTGEVATTGLIVWGEDAQMLNAVSGGDPVAHGAAVVRWLAEDSNNALDQTVAGSQPIANLDAVLPGRNAVSFSAARHLAGTVAAPPGTILIIVGPQGSLARTLVSRDTSQVTTAPAFSIAVEEYFL